MNPDQWVFLCKAKLNKAVVTSCQRDYSGSIAIDGRVLKELGVHPYEKVLVVNRDKGHRFETYVVPADDGVVEMQGGAALLADVGDTIGFLAFCMIEDSKAEEWHPKVVELLDDATIKHIK